MVNTRHEEYYEAESFWSGQALKDPGNMRRIETTIDMVPKKVRTLLDVGCGNGVFGHMLLEERPEIDMTGVDRSKAALKHVRFTSQIASIDELPFVDKSFDLVSCLQVIEHLPNDIYRSSLEELARVAGQYLIVGIPFEEDLEAETTQCPQCRTIFNINFHLRNYQLTDVQGLLVEFGFKAVKHEFPAAKIRTKHINEIVAWLKGQTKKTNEFISPICPVCSYSEGDKTSLNKQPVATAPALPVSGSLPKQLAKGALRALSTVLPKEEVKGYWVVALYERA